LLISVIHLVKGKRFLCTNHEGMQKE
jgi:hypothetical protein